MLSGEGNNAYIFAGTCLAIIFMAVAAHRRHHGNLFRDLRRGNGHIPRRAGEPHRTARRRFDGRSDILVYLHSCGRAFVYLCDSRACQEHGGEQPHGIGRGGEVFSFLTRYNGDARRCGARNPYRKFRIATHCEYLSDLEHDKIIDGIVRCLRRGLDQRLFQSGV